VETHLAIGLPPHQPDGQPTAQLSAGGLVADAAVEAGAQHMQLRLGHGALESEHEPVVEQPGVVEAVGIADQRIRGPAQVQQPVPIGIVARQSRHLQSEDDPHLAQRNLRS
jgi:hypothetical protein